LARGGFVVFGDRDFAVGGLLAFGLVLAIAGFGIVRRARFAAGFAFLLAPFPVRLAMFTLHYQSGRKTTACPAQNESFRPLMHAACRQRFS
jgi:hypothetical protein